MPVEEQVISIYAGTEGVLDDLPVAEIRRFETELLEWFRSRHSGLLSEIRDTGKLPEGDAVESAVGAFKTQFVATLSGDDAPSAHADPNATDAEAPGEAESDKTLKTE